MLNGAPLNTLPLNTLPVVVAVQEQSGSHRFLRTIYYNEMAERLRLKQQREEEEMMTIISAFIATRKST